MVKRLVSGGKGGLKAWLMQQATALIMALYTLLLLGVMGVSRPASFEAWRAVFAAGFMRLATLIFFACLFYHAWLGLGGVFRDHVKSARWRFIGMTASAALLIGYAGWVVRILWGV